MKFGVGELLGHHLVRCPGGASLLTDGVIVVLSPLPALQRFRRSC